MIPPPSTPWGLTLIGDVLYVVENGNNRVQKFIISGNYLGRFDSKGSGDGQFNAPFSLGICTDRKGHILVADQCNSRVQVFTADGSFTSSFSYSDRPYDVAVDNTGNIHVAFFISNHIAVFSPDGQQQLSTYNANRNLCLPGAVAIDDNGYRFVGDLNSRCVRVIDPQGGLIIMSSITDYAGVYGVILDTHGDIMLLITASCVFASTKINIILCTKYVFS